MKRALIAATALLVGGLVISAMGAGPPDGERPRPFGPRDREGPRPPGPFARGQDPMMQHLFPPPLILESAEEIGLTEQQRNAIREEMERSRDKVEPAHERLRQQMEALAKVLGAEKINEQQALDQLDKVLVAEAEIKVAHLTTLLRIKNLLSREQQEKLRSIMKERRPSPPEGERVPRPPFERERGPGRGGDRRPPPPQPE